MCAAILLAEIGLRIAGISFPSFYVPDDRRGMALRPGAEGWWRKEGEAYIRINEDGLRDRTHSRQKPVNAFRIAVLGDSYAEALQVPIENTFWHVMERQLEQCAALSGRKVETINFGVSGYGTAQELLTLRYHSWKYSPDVVILAVLSGNDVRNNSRALEQDSLRPYFFLENGEPVLDSSFADSFRFRFLQSWLAKVLFFVIDHFRVAQVLNEARREFRAQLSRNAQEGEAGLDNMIYFEPRDSAWTDAWKVTEALLVLMSSEVKARGAKFLVVTLSSGIQVHPDSVARRDLAQHLGIHDLFYPDLRIKALGEREGFAVLNLAPAFQSYAEQHKVFLHGFESDLGRGHWNEAGHRLGGMLMARELCDEF